MRSLSTVAMTITVHVAMVMLALLKPLLGIVYVPNVDKYEYVREGDIMIGSVIPIHECAGNCSDIHDRMFQAAEAIAYAIDIINNDSTILPNIKLGVRIFDNQLNSTMSLARVVQMLPNKYVKDIPNPDQDVVGIFGGITSDSCLVMARFLQLFNIPLLSPRCTNDALTDFPNFVRLIPPDRHQLRIMLDIIKHYNWTYISFVYVDNAYGRNALKHMQDLTKVNGVCLAATEALTHHPSQEDIDHTIKALRTERKARVIVSFLYAGQVLKILERWDKIREGSNSRFLWIFSDSIQVPVEPKVSERVMGSFFLNFDLGSAGKFNQYFGDRTGLDFRRERNPWWKDFYKSLFDCDCDTDCDFDCDWTPVRRSKKYVPYDMNPIFIDGVKVFAHALHNVVANNCPIAFEDKAFLHGCLTEQRLLRELYKVKINGTMGEIRFDSNGDYMGGYEITQQQRTWNGYEKKPIGFWSRITESDSHLEMLDTADFNMFRTVTDLSSRIGKITQAIYIPQGLISACSLPCRLDEIKVITDLKCCWECHPCDENEYLVSNRTKCRRCERNKWPNQKTFTSCEEILPSALLWFEPFGLVLTAMTCLGFLLTLWIGYVFFKHARVRVIRASGRELSMIILFGVLMSYFCIAIILSGPGDVRCYFQRICYHLSYTIIYAPLLIKTNWIYRLFNVVKAGKTKPKLAGANTQVLITCLQIIPQETRLEQFNFMSILLKVVNFVFFYGPMFWLITNIVRCIIEEEIESSG